MKSRRMLAMTIIAGALAAAGGWAISAQDKYTVKVPGGLALSEFRGYESWEFISASYTAPNTLAVTLGNPAMIAALKAGIPDNGQPFPDGAKMAKVHYNTQKHETFPQATVPASQHDVDVMLKDSKRFADSGGWGYGYFEYDAASRAFRPATLASTPPQGNDAKCGFACHTVAKSKDYVFTKYQPR